MFDNTTAVVSVKKQGSVHSPDCNEMSREIWDFVLEWAVWLSITHVLGVKNVEVADTSRMFKDETEWGLNMADCEQIGV